LEKESMKDDAATQEAEDDVKAHVVVDGRAPFSVLNVQASVDARTMPSRTEDSRPTDHLGLTFVPFKSQTRPRTAVLEGWTVEGSRSNANTRKRLRTYFKTVDGSTHTVMTYVVAGGRAPSSTSHEKARVYAKAMPILSVSNALTRLFLPPVTNPLWDGQLGPRCARHSAPRNSVGTLMVHVPCARATPSREVEAEKNDLTGVRLARLFPPPATSPLRDGQLGPRASSVPQGTSQLGRNLDGPCAVCEGLAFTVCGGRVPSSALHEMARVRARAMPQRTAGFEDTLRVRGTRRDSPPVQAPHLVKMAVHKFETHCRDQGLETIGLMHEVFPPLRCAFRRARGSCLHAKWRPRNCSQSMRSSSVPQSTSQLGRNLDGPCAVCEGLAFTVCGGRVRAAFQEHLATRSDPMVHVPCARAMPSRGERQSQCIPQDPSVAPLLLAGALPKRQAELSLPLVVSFRRQLDIRSHLV
jgi:hypothetical protein